MNTPAEYRHDTTLKLGENRGNPRVWIEGNHLLKAGFTPDARFRATFGEGSIVLELVEDGDRTISGRNRGDVRLPIIDINTAQITQALGTPPRIAVKLSRHRIEITPSRLSLLQTARILTALAIGCCVGGGLMTHAAKAAGFDTVAACEIDEQFAAVHEANHEGHTLNACMSEADFQAVAARVGPVGLLHAGIPCEPFSRIRRNTGNAKADSKLAPEAHELGDMTFWTLRAVDIVNPHTVVIEEVPAWLDSGAGWIAAHTLRRMGYTVDSRVVDASDLGALTSRKRAYMVATMFSAVTWPEAYANTRRLSEVLHAPDDPRCEWFTRETPSKQWLFNHWTTQTEKGNGFASCLVRYTDAKIGTIKKRYFAGQGDNQVVVHPTDETRFRWLTVDEVRGIMGLPESYNLGTAKTIAGEIMGQGVHVGAVAQIIRAVTQQPISQRLTA